MSQSIFRTVIRGLSGAGLVTCPSVRLQTVPKRFYAAALQPTDFIFRPVRKT